MMRQSRTPENTWSQFVNVTPAMAGEWLARNTNNRPVSNYKVKLYADAMKEGRWRLTHQGIGFDVDGNLLDGQHRLHAVKESGITITFLVTYNLPPDSIFAIDRGMVRRPGHIVRIALGEGYGRDEAAIARVVAALRLGLTDLSGATIESDILKEEIEINLDAMSWCRKFYAPHRFIRKPVYGAFVFAWPIDTTKVNEFAQRVTTGVSLLPRSPELALHNYLISLKGRSRAGSVLIQEMVAKTLNAIKLFLQGKEAVRVGANESAVAWIRGRRKALHIDP